MLDFLLDIYKGHPPEDEIVMQYINVGLSKAGAVIGLVSTMDTYHDKWYSWAIGTWHLMIYKTLCAELHFEDYCSEIHLQKFQCIASVYSQML